MASEKHFKCCGGKEINLEGHIRNNTIFSESVPWSSMQDALIYGIQDHNVPDLSFANTTVHGN